jgi:predicted Zn-dependent protease
MLQELKAMPQGAGPSIAKTHPAPQDRIDRVMKLISKDPPVTLSPTEVSRYQTALGGL